MADSKPAPKPLAEITFRCSACSHVFKTEPARIEGAPESPHHPFAYFAPCPGCQAECSQVWWERNLLKAHANATGPTTPDGKAAVTENLAGHPTPEEALRTRFNAMKHGLSARTATYFPAKPGGYDFCLGCHVDMAWCATQAACTRQTEIFLLHHAAFEQKDPKRLMGIYSDLQGALFAVLQQILQTIIRDGVKIEAPQWWTDKETGKLIIAEYIDEFGERRILKDINAHPLFKPLGELISRNNLSLADMGMTAKVFEAEEVDMGQLSQDGAKESLTEFQRRSVAALENLAGMVSRAKEKTESDPILAEYRREAGDEAEVVAP